MKSQYPNRCQTYDQVFRQVDFLGFRQGIMGEVIGFQAPSLLEYLSSNTPIPQQIDIVQSQNASRVPLRSINPSRIGLLRFMRLLDRMRAVFVEGVGYQERVSHVVFWNENVRFCHAFYAPGLDF
jgi:hypothetical protein